MDLVTEQRLARRAAIMAVAREMILERGYEAVTVRDLAQVCRVSVPTLYNQFGGKDQLLAAAIEDYFSGGLNTQLIDEGSSGIDRLLAVIDQCAEQLLAAPRFNQRLLEAFASIRSTEQIQQRIAHNLITVLSKALQALADEGQLAAWVSCDQVAGQMMSTSIGTAVQWSAGVIEDHLLVTHMRYAMGLVALGALRGVAAQKLEVVVQAAQRDLTSTFERAFDSNNRSGAR